MEEKEKMLHTHLALGQVGEYVFLPGSPERSQKISTYFDRPEKMAQHREHTTYSGFLDEVMVTVSSTGMGGPSTSICMEELVRLGAKTFIRVGTCASVSALVKRGDVVIPNAAVRMEGTGLHYLPVEFPAVPDFYMVKKLEEAVLELGFPYNIGVTISRDSFFTSVEPEKKPVGYELINKWSAYEKGGATSSEMEAATVFLVAATLQVRAAALLVSATNYKKYGIDAEVYPTDTEKRAIEVGILAMRKIIAEDKKRE